MESTCTVLESQVDYVRATTRTLDKSRTLVLLGQTLTEYGRETGEYVKAWGMQGFKGLQAGAFAWGYRGDEALLQASGAAAECLYTEVLPLADNISRLDLQVTARILPAVPNLALREYPNVTTAGRGRGKPPKATLIQDSKHGQDLLIGTRSSERYARLYNKEAESPGEGYEACWRWELECKGQSAAPMARFLAAAADGPATTARVVYDHFAKRGVVPPWKPQRVPLPNLSAGRGGDVRRTLEWLRCQVRPALRRVAASGELASAVSALGLNTPYYQRELAAILGFTTG